MNWARGLKLASIHLGIAVLLITWEEAPLLFSGQQHSDVTQGRIVAAFHEDQATSFSPCGKWRSSSWREKVLAVSELPAMTVSGWNDVCPRPWTIAGVVGIDSKHHSLLRRLALAFGVCGLIAIQWILLGGLPLVKPRRWWLEPGAANTLLTCTVIPVLWMCEEIAGSLDRSESGAFVFGLMAILMFLLISSTWIAWLGLVTWRLARLGWQGATSSVPAARSR